MLEVLEAQSVRAELGLELATNQHRSTGTDMSRGC